MNNNSQLHCNLRACQDRAEITVLLFLNWIYFSVRFFISWLIYIGRTLSHYNIIGISNQSLKISSTFMDSNSDSLIHDMKASLINKIFLNFVSSLSFQFWIWFIRFSISSIVRYSIFGTEHFGISTLEKSIQIS